MCTVMKTHVAELHPTSETSLKEAMKRVWTTEIKAEYCQSLASSMPQEVLSNKGGYT